LQLSPDGFPNDPEKQSRYEANVFSKAEREAEIGEMKAILEAVGSPVVFCHNDLGSIL
jgi:thiamine kinase-like enzyme